jgi:acyl dehydratase
MQRRQSDALQGARRQRWHTAAITMRLLVDSGVPLAVGLIGLGGSLSWPRPVRPGDVLTVHGEITEVTASKPDRGMIAIKAQTRNQHGDVVQSFQRGSPSRLGGLLLCGQRTILQIQPNV